MAFGAINARLHAALFRAEQTRNERRLRAGAGFSSSSNRVEEPGTGIVAPIAAGEESAPVTIAFSLEFFGAPDYPNGTLLDTGEFVVASVVGGTLSVTGTTIALSVDLSDPTVRGGGQPPTGRHFLALYLEPGAPGRAGLFVDGDQVYEDTGNFTDWSSGTWSYADGVTGIGQIGPLEVYPNFFPPSFIG